MVWRCLLPLLTIATVIHAFRHKTEDTNLVLGAAQGIPPEHLSIFVQSWQRWAPNTKVVLFVMQLEPFMANLAQFAEFVTVPFEEGHLWPNYRFQLCQEYLRVHGDQYTMVVLADVRDVAVQSNPWAHPMAQQALAEKAVLMSEEYQTRGHQLIKLTYAEEMYNNDWGHKCLGKEQYDRCLRDSAILNVGFILGYSSAVLHYLDYSQELLTSWHNISGCGKNVLGPDSIANAYMAYCAPTHAKPRLIIAPLQQSVVNTLATSFPHPSDAFENVITLEGHVSPVVHQYDRSHELMMSLMRKYPIHNILINNTHPTYHQLEQNMYNKTKGEVVYESF